MLNRIRTLIKIRMADKIIMVMQEGSIKEALEMVDKDLQDFQTCNLIGAILNSSNKLMTLNGSYRQ